MQVSSPHEVALDVAAAFLKFFFDIEKRSGDNYDALGVYAADSVYKVVRPNSQSDLLEGADAIKDYVTALPPSILTVDNFHAVESQDNSVLISCSGTEVIDITTYTFHRVLLLAKTETSYYLKSDLHNYFLSSEGAGRNRQKQRREKAAASGKTANDQGGISLNVDDIFATEPAGSSAKSITATVIASTTAAEEAPYTGAFVSSAVLEPDNKLYNIYLPTPYRFPTPALPPTPATAPAAKVNKAKTQPAVVATPVQAEPLPAPVKAVEPVVKDAAAATEAPASAAPAIAEPVIVESTAPIRRKQPTSWANAVSGKEDAPVEAPPAVTVNKPESDGKKRQPPRKPSASCFVKQLPANITSDEISQAFSVFGTVTGVSASPERKTAIVNFDADTAAQKAIAQGVLQIGENKATIEPKLSFKKPYGNNNNKSRYGGDNANNNKPKTVTAA